MMNVVSKMMQFVFMMNFAFKNDEFCNSNDESTQMIAMDIAVEAEEYVSFYAVLYRFYAVLHRFYAVFSAVFVLKTMNDERNRLLT